MAQTSVPEKMFLEEISQIAQTLLRKQKHLPLGGHIKLIRQQLGMSQRDLARRCHMTQAMISKIEGNKALPTFANLKHILDTLSCDLLVIPLLRAPIESIRRKQANLIAQKQMRYLQGTMSLEKQEPDKHLVERMTKQKTEELLHTPGSKLWEE